MRELLRSFSIVKLTVILFVCSGLMAMKYVYQTDRGPHLFELFSGEAAPATFMLVDLDSVRSRLDLADHITIIFLFSPGYHCPFCVDAVPLWESRVVTLGLPAMRTIVVGDGTQTDQNKLLTLAEETQFGSQVYLDSNGSIRRAYHLDAGPAVLGLSPSGSMLFCYPLGQAGSATESEASESRVIDSLLAGAYVRG